MRKLLIFALLYVFFSCQEKIGEDYCTIFTLTKSKREQCCSGDFVTTYKQYFSINILVEHTPKNKITLQRLMIYHFLRMTSGVDTIQTHSELKSAICTFIKSTPITRRYFTAPPKYSYGDAYADGIITDKTYIGGIAVDRCKDDHTKLMVEIYVSLENNYEYKVRSPKQERHILLNECEPDWYESNKNNELVKYYMELKDKK